MNRRNSIGLIGASSLLMVQKAFPSMTTPLGNTADNEFMNAFNPRWEGLRTHTFEVLDAMPEPEFDFRPTEAVKSYSELFFHMGKSLDIYAEMLGGTAHEEHTETSYKGAVRAYLTGCFIRFEQVMAKLNPEDLYGVVHTATTRDGKISMSGLDVLMLAYNHTVHHKGQATTYLRLQGVIPPQYRF